LPHPFDFGPVGNFILTPMSYYTWDYSFGQADKDALRRAHVDSLYLQVQSTMNQLAQSGVDVSLIFIQLKDVDTKYNQMDYEAALASVLQAESTVNNMLSSSSRGIIQQAPVGGSVTFLLLAASLGLLVGVALAWLLIKRGVRGPSTRARKRRTALARRRRSRS